jgi:hypothetical protein
MSYGVSSCHSVATLILTGQVRTRFLEKEAAISTETQQHKEKSLRTRKRRLRELGIKLSSLRC